MKAVMFLAAAALNLSLMLPTLAQAPSPPTASQSPASTAKTFSQQELDQLLAPIALYPDALLAQILMASTYPLEVVSAERWVKANPGLKGKALEDALQKQSWDPSVKSLAVFPEVLTMMSEKIDWTQKLGDAFLAQQKDVLATAQALRSKAMAQGTLKDSNEQRVVTETAGTTTTIKIEPTNPEVVYVPTYNPTVVYGAWPYPAYPPYYYYPPGYTAGGMLLSFTAGAIVGGALWGDCDWGRGDVNVNVNRYNSFNRTNISNRNWSHNAVHRGAVPYRSRTVAQQYGRVRPVNTASREQFRGRAEAGRSSIQRGEVSGNFGSRAAGRSSTTAPSRNLSERGTAGGRSLASGSRSASSSARGLSNASAFDTSRGAQTRNYSSRGASSLGSARASGNFGGGGRMGGGGRIGGGGRGGGRR